MAHREILPVSLRPSHYSLVITNLDYNTWSYTGFVE